MLPHFYWYHFKTEKLGYMIKYTYPVYFVLQKVEVCRIKKLFKKMIFASTRYKKYPKNTKIASVYFLIFFFFFFCGKKIRKLEVCGYLKIIFWLMIGGARGTGVIAAHVLCQPHLLHWYICVVRATLQEQILKLL